MFVRDGYGTLREYDDEEAHGRPEHLPMSAARWRAHQVWLIVRETGVLPEHISAFLRRHPELVGVESAEVARRFLEG